MKEGQLPAGGPGFQTDTPTDKELFFYQMIEVPSYGPECGPLGGGQLSGSGMNSGGGGQSMGCGTCGACRTGQGCTDSIGSMGGVIQSAPATMSLPQSSVTLPQSTVTPPAIGPVPQRSGPSFSGGQFPVLAPHTTGAAAPTMDSLPGYIQPGTK